MKTETRAKSLREMQAEVKANCVAKGWYDQPVSFAEAMALLHSEVSEALEAWRRWGFRDATGPGECEDRQCGDSTWDHPCPVTSKPPKPEGVGSEFADVFIRWLDYAGRFGADLDAATANPGRFALSESFPENINTLHGLIALCSHAGPGEFADRFGAILTFLRQCCDECGVDLAAEYERKMAFNRSRPYRHGGKRN